MAKSNRGRDQISQQVSGSIELRKATELLKDQRLRQELVGDHSNLHLSLSDEQMLTLLLERMGNLAGAVSGSENLEQLESALLKVTTFSKIWLENIERRFHRGN